MRVLITGFEPFGGEPENASGDAVTLLSHRWVGPCELTAVILPVSFVQSQKILGSAIERYEPDAVVCVGEAGGRQAVTPELWAGVRVDARIPDNDGAQPVGALLDAGPERIASRIDPHRLVVAIQAAGIAAEVSRDAGTFVCNAVFRGALTLSSGPACFVHVPAIRTSGRATVGTETDIQTVPAPGGPGAIVTSIDDVVIALRAVVEEVVTIVKFSNGD